jgi:8-oxo-dGTP diphosphatase
MIKNQAVAAIIQHKNRILCVQRGVGQYPYISLKWEFPGGKVDVGETTKMALKREIFEELEMDILVEDEFLKVIHSYPDFTFSLHSFMCSCISPEFTLTEHLDFKWLLKEELLQLDWVEADVLIVEELMKLK